MSWTKPFPEMLSHLKIVDMPMFMNSNADLADKETPDLFGNKECLQKQNCKCAARGNGPRASRAETETEGC